MAPLRRLLFSTLLCISPLFCMKQTLMRPKKLFNFFTKQRRLLSLTNAIALDEYYQNILPPCYNPLFGLALTESPFIPNLLTKNVSCATSSLTGYLFYQQNNETLASNLATQASYAITPRRAAQLLQLPPYCNAYNEQAINNFVRSWKKEHTLKCKFYTKPMTLSEKPFLKFITVLQNAQKEATSNESWVPHKLPELLMSAFVAKKYNQKQDFLTYLRELGFFEPRNKRIISPTKQEINARTAALHKSLTRVPQKKIARLLKALPAITVTSLLLTEKGDCTPLERVKDQLCYVGKKFFCNCAEATLCDLVSIILYNDYTHSYDLNLLPSTITMRPEFKQFFLTTTPQTIASLKTQEWWTALCSNIDSARYCKKEYELDTGVDNLIALLNYMFNLHETSLEGIAEKLSGPQLLKLSHNKKSPKLNNNALIDIDITIAEKNLFKEGQLNICKDHSYITTKKNSHKLRPYSALILEELRNTHKTKESLFYFILASLLNLDTDTIFLAHKRNKKSAHYLPALLLCSWNIDTSTINTILFQKSIQLQGHTKNLFKRSLISYAKKTDHSALFNSVLNSTLPTEKKLEYLQIMISNKICPKKISLDFSTPITTLYETLICLTQQPTLQQLIACNKEEIDSLIAHIAFQKHSFSEKCKKIIALVQRYPNTYSSPSLVQLLGDFSVILDPKNFTTTCTLLQKLCSSGLALKAQELRYIMGTLTPTLFLEEHLLDNFFELITLLITLHPKNLELKNDAQTVLNLVLAYSIKTGTTKKRLLKLLLKHKGTPHDSFYRYLVHYNKHTVASILLEHDTDQHHRDQLFKHSVYSGNQAAVSLLLDHGYPINKQDQIGETCLHHVLKHINSTGDDHKKTLLAMYSFLVQKGADRRIKNCFGEAPASETDDLII